MLFLFIYRLRKAFNNKRFVLFSFTRKKTTKNSYLLRKNIAKKAKVLYNGKVRYISIYIKIKKDDKNKG